MPMGKKGKKYGGITTIPLYTLLDIMEFALDNTFILDLDGRILKQNKGIPMGDPHSPGMCIITCAWMEKEWQQSLDDDTKSRFMAKRFYHR